MSSKSVLAIAAHPDDIEFVMAGTLLRLAEQGWEVHYFNVANGCCGSMTLSPAACAAVRLKEAQAAAAALPAKFYPPICNDMEVFYGPSLLPQVAAVVRAAQPQIILTHAMVDYMEDHQNAARLAVGAAFTRGMPNFHASPATATCDHDVAIYHAQPHGNRTPMGDPVRPTHWVDIEPQMPKKRELLGAHESQGQWLDDTQRMSSYLQTMEDLNREVGSMSSRFRYAEGWRRHLHLGLSEPGFDPLQAALTDCIEVN
ncbi:PIG-L deacetylase family protein [Aureliella helgolandensis]|uniref:GlcNAc-PI de-N-acetylase n=1 Tax=Aureliella helgolandensis TaxID=2527968 RepID=A0A518GD99_9BACT|nr:PIG-L family deacetylase [Aureliella helgolandensis]QDV26571.1 GlcNAc-PI de-N-acetylase [Aureliella helgolandensis]